MGSGTTIRVSSETKPVLLRGRKPAREAALQSSYGDFQEAPATAAIQVDGHEAKVERTPLRYEKVEDIFDELPDFAQEIIAKRYLDKE